MKASPNNFSFRNMFSKIINWLYAEKVRTQQIQAIAEELHGTFSPKGDGSILHAMKPFQLYSRGGVRKVKNIIHTHTEDSDLSLFDYRYILKVGKGVAVYKQTTFRCASPAFAFPSFHLWPENLFHKIGAVFGYQDIDFDMHPTFSTRYVLQGQPEADVRHMFSSNPLLLSYYEEHPNLATEGISTECLVYYAARRFSPEHLREFWEDCLELCELFKLGATSQASLLAALDDEQAPVRRDAARAIGLFRDASVLPTLRPLLNDPDEGVRQAAVWTLGVMRDACVITTLLHALHDPSGTVREEAVTALRKACPLARIIIFGQDTAYPDVEERHTVWNPDLSDLTILMSSLKGIVIDTHTYDFHQVERCVTYAINALGQKYMRKQVEVHIYGDPEKLHPNLQNSLTNLCKRVHVHHMHGLST